MRILPILLILSSSFNFLSGQDNWSLEKCINYALEKNLLLKQSELAVAQSEITLNENKHKRYPDLNAGINAGISFGRNINPTTNTFVTEDIGYTNYSLSSSVILFQGGYVNHSIKRSKLERNAAKESYLQGANDLSLEIATYFLNVLLSDERLEIAGKNLESIQQQLLQMNAFIRAGSKAEADALEIEAQVAMSEQTLVGAENALDLAWLQLKQAMRYKETEDFSLQKLSEDQLNDLAPNNYTSEELFLQSSQTRHGLKSAEAKLQSAKIGEQMARSLYYPSLYFSGNVGSRFSDAAKIPSSYNFIKESIPGIFIDGKSVTFERAYFEVLASEVVPFKDQFDQFLGYGFGLSLNVPIYKNWATRSNVQRSKIETAISDIQLELQKEQLNQQIVQSIANVKAAQKEYDASQKSLKASYASHEKTQKKFEIGTASVFELNLSQNNFQAAEINVVIAKYDLLFKTKVLDYYAGKKIKL